MPAGYGDTIGKSYKYFCDYYGILEHLTFYGAIEQIFKNTFFMRTINKYGITYIIFQVQ